MSQPHPGPDRYDPASFPPTSPAGEPMRPGRSSRWLQMAVIAVPLALVLIPAIWGLLPGEIARWHDAAAKEKYLEGDVEGAIAELGIAISKSDTSATRYILRAQYRQELKDFEGSLEDLNAAIQVFPNESGLLVLRSNVWQHLGKHREAVDDALAAKAILEKRAWGGDERIHANSLNNLAYVRGVGNLELDQALANAQEVAELLGGDAYMLEQVGYLHILRKDWKRAKSRLQESAALFENEIESLKKLAEQASDKGAKANASSLLVKSQDRLAGVQFHLAQVCRELNEKDDAAKFERLFSEWGRTEKEMRDRLPTLLSAWEYARQVGAYIDTRGYNLYRLGDLISARRDLELATEIYEIDVANKEDRFREKRLGINDIRVFEKEEAEYRRGAAVVLYHRALLYQKLGLTDLAEEDLRRVKEVYGATPGDNLF